ncbi:Uncharacterized protein pbN1_12880 [Aromatoleum bremense]|nr:Uncharacterized protein pbN1_12880 [Aromatoleum bremense]
MAWFAAACVASTALPGAFRAMTAFFPTPAERLLKAAFSARSL